MISAGEQEDLLGTVSCEQHKQTDHSVFYASKAWIACFVVSYHRLIIRSTDNIRLLKGTPRILTLSLDETYNTIISINSTIFPRMAHMFTGVKSKKVRSGGDVVKNRCAYITSCNLCISCSWRYSGSSLACLKKTPPKNLYIHNFDINSYFVNTHSACGLCTVNLTHRLTSNLHGAKRVTAGGVSRISYG